MQKMNFKENYSKRYSEGGSKWYFQNGLEYDMKGNAMNKKQVRERIAADAAVMQVKADEAMAAAKASQQEADEAQALLDGPDAPKTVASLKTALDEQGIPYSGSALKPELEQLWVDAQAA